MPHDPAVAGQEPMGSPSSQESKNFKLVIEYDGRRYHGWQRQRGCPTIQETIENRISTMTGAPVTLIASGRTDAGVHALGQTANFRSSTRILPDALQKGLNSLLPDDIVIHQVRQVDAAFHSRYDVKRKTYRYHFWNRPVASAIGRNYRWHIRRPLDLCAMCQAAQSLVGSHDFKSFEGAGSPRSSTVRTVYESCVRENPSGEITFTITANGFLRFMVRNIVGTLAEIGLGRAGAKEMGRILVARDRRLAGSTAPAHGLFLVEVVY